MITYKEITYQLNFLEKVAEKSLFLQIVLTNLQEKSHVISEAIVVSYFLFNNNLYNYIII